MPRRYRPNPLLVVKRIKRYEAMAALYKNGLTLEQIGEQYSCTRENVRQCLARVGAKSTEGGAAKRRSDRKERQLIEREEQSRERWGCSFADYLKIRSVKKATLAFRSQKRAARPRGIEWQLSLSEWWSIWEKSGLWNQRGLGQGYVMCRHGDVGPYAVGNVFIALCRENSSERAGKLRRDLPMGVMQRKGRKDYLAQRMIGGKQIHLGYYDTPEEAHMAYLRAAPAGSVEARLFAESELYRWKYTA